MKVFFSLPQIWLTLWCLINDPILIADPMADFQWNYKQLDPNCQLDGTFLGKINSRPYVLCSKVIQIRVSMNFNQKYLIDSMEIWPSRWNFDENIYKRLGSLIRHHRVYALCTIPRSQCCKHTTPFPFSLMREKGEERCVLAALTSLGIMHLDPFYYHFIPL